VGAFALLARVGLAHAQATNPSCNDATMFKNPIYLTGSSAFEPTASRIAVKLSALATPYTVIYNSTGSCSEYRGLLISVVFPRRKHRSENDDDSREVQCPRMSFQPLQRERPGRRRFWAPEIVQTSAMDCGPAALKCVFEGFGVKVSYGRLREACQTSVDGTSMDTLEKVAASLGLEATQLMLSVEHAVAARARTLPAIAVVRTPGGLTHFVVLWRRLGPYLQVMDPARGRRWVRAAAFWRELHVHTQSIDVASFRELVADPTFTAILAARLAALGGGDCDHQSLIAAAIAEESWQAIARLDGATRATETLIGDGLLSRGKRAQRLWRVLAATPNAVAEEHACVTRADAGPGREERVLLRGAVLIHLAGRPPRA